ncbi:hypothetical protein D3C86_1927460 [compost metagenome]
MGAENGLSAHQRMSGDPALLAQFQPGREDRSVGGDIGGGMKARTGPCGKVGLPRPVFGAFDILGATIPGQELQASLVPSLVFAVLVEHHANLSSSAGSIS